MQYTQGVGRSVAYDEPLKYAASPEQRLCSRASLLVELCKKAIAGRGMYGLAELRTMTLSPANERIGPEGNHCSYSRMIGHLTTVE